MHYPAALRPHRSSLIVGALLLLAAPRAEARGLLIFVGEALDITSTCCGNRPRGLYHWEFGGQVVGLALGGGNAEEAVQGYGGIGVQARYRMRRHWGLELAASVLHGELEDGAQRDVVPLTGSLLYYLFPESRLQPYGLAGVGLAPARWSTADDETIGASTSPMVQLGAGALLDLHPLRIYADVRGVSILPSA